MVLRWIVGAPAPSVIIQLDELNQAIWALLDARNALAFQKIEGSRESAFEALDKPAL